MTEGRLDVEAVTPRSREYDAGRDVHRHADERDREHPAAEDVARVAKPHHRLHEDPDRERDEQHAVHERGENLHALVAVGALGRRRLGREPGGEEREPESHVVGEHVDCVREQREALRVEAADHLDHGVRRGQEKSGRERTAALDARVIVVVAHALGSTGPSGRSPRPRAP